MIPSIEILRVQEDFNYGTFGILKINKIVFCWTLERPDIENEVNISSIPAQQYTCKRYHSSKYPNTFEITNVPNRTKVLFHSANIDNQIKGCIALGERLGYLYGDRAIMNSGATFRRFMEEMKGISKFHLTIKEEY